MNFFDRTIAAISPRWGYSRARFREALAAYEAAKPSRLRKSGADNSSGNTVVGAAGPALRGYSRTLEQNYDVAKGVLDVLVNNTVGPHGISWEPQPRTLSGEIHEDFAKQLLNLWQDFSLCPEVTWQHDYAAAERLAARTWFRDGELLVQFLEGNISSLDHGTRVPFSLELIEADLLPFDLHDESKNIYQGIECNAWGRPLAYHVYKKHPGDLNFSFNSQTKRVSSDRMLHPKIVNRIGQLRGISVFASVLRRIEDLKDYEESERIAARVAAALTGYIKKGQPEDYAAPTDGNAERMFSMKPGMIFDGLRIGEEVGTIASNRPSSLLEPFHKTMVRNVCAGTGTSNSSVSKNYDGTYSAQRQELVESHINYQVCTQLFVGQYSRPIRQRFTQIAVLSGLVKIPRDLDINTITAAEFRGPAMPWIDPVKEAQGAGMLEENVHKSPQQIIRERGGDPETVLQQTALWRRKCAELGVRSMTDPANKNPTPAPATAGVSVSEKEEEEQDA